MVRLRLVIVKVNWCNFRQCFSSTVTYSCYETTSFSKAALDSSINFFSFFSQVFFIFLIICHPQKYKWAVFIDSCYEWQYLLWREVQVVSCWTSVQPFSSFETMKQCVFVSNRRSIFILLCVVSKAVVLRCKVTAGKLWKSSGMFESD